MSILLKNTTLRASGNPSDFKDNILWLDMADYSTYSFRPGTDYTTLLLDKSGKGNNAVQATEVYQPLYVVGVKNGNSVLRCDSDFMVSPLNMNSYTNMTIFAVYRLNAVGGSVIRCLFGQNNGGYDRTLYATLMGIAKLGKGNGDAITISDFTPQDVWYSFAVVYNGASSAVYTGNTLSTTFTALAPSGTIDTAIGNGSSSNSYNFQGDIAEIIMYGRALSDNERNAVVNYLSNKWAI